MRVVFAAIAVLLCVCAGVAWQAGPEQLFREAQEAQQHGDTELAIHKYKEITERHPEVVAAHANLGVALSSVGRYDEAIREYHFALAQAPASAPLILDLGLAYYKKGDFADAAAQFAILRQQDSNDVRVATLLGNCDVQLGLVEQALAILQPLEKTNPDNLDVEWAMGTALIRAGRTLDGLKRVQKVADQKNSAEAYQLAADYYLGLTFFDLAKHDAEALLRLNPKSTNAYVVLGMVADYAGDAKTAAGNYQRAVELNPNDLDTRIHLASALIDKGDLTAARQQLKRALELQPNSSGAHYHLARIEQEEGNSTAALGDLEAAERQDPHWLSPHIQLAAMYYRLKRPTDGDREKAIVDQLREEERKRREEAHVISPQVHPQ